jgi:hypothetical protein
MKVKELIKLLEVEDQEKIVIVDGYEGGFDELKSIRHICISVNPDKEKDPGILWYYGDYEECIPNPNFPEDYAIYFPRNCKFK